MLTVRPSHLRRAVGPLVAAAAVLGVPAAASAAASYGYVWADSPTAASYTPVDTHQANSAGKVNTIQRIGTGQYRITFPGLARAANGGTVNVTAYGEGGRSYCGVVSWGPSARKMIVDVRCADTTGALVDAMFDATYAVPAARGTLGYVWANQPTATAYTPEPFYQFNSKGAVNTITRNAVGSYTVRLPKLGIDAGTVKVTTYGAVSTRCKVHGWGSSSADQIVNVLCFNSAGIPVDSLYTMTFASERTLLGSNGSFGYAWANSPSAPSYTPAAQYSSSSPAGPIGITRLSTGRYVVAFTGLVPGFFGDVQVTAYGSGSNECRVGYWFPESLGNHVEVECYDTAGTAADTLYTVQFLG